MAIDVFVKCLAKHSDAPSGDAFWYAERCPFLWTVVVDGLGHGVEASVASRLAVERIEGEVARLHEACDFDPTRSLTLMLHCCDEALRATRGAALGLGLFDLSRDAGYFAGIGNVEMRVVGGKSHVHPVAVPGIVGTGLRRVRVESFAYRGGDLILMHSDGLGAHFDLDGREVIGRSLEEIGEGLISTHSKKDDITLLLVRQHA